MLWIPDSRYPVDGFQSLNSDFEFQSLVGLRIADFKTRDSRFNKQNFPGFRISQAVRNRDCKCMKVIQGKLTLVRVSEGYLLWPNMALFHVTYHVISRIATVIHQTSS